MKLNSLNKLLKVLPNKEAQLLFYLIKYAGKYENEWEEMISQKSELNPKPFDSWFDGKDRIYIPFKVSPDAIEPPRFMKEFLEDFGYTFISYVLGLVSKEGEKNQIKFSGAISKIEKDQQTKLDTVKQQVDDLSQSRDELSNQIKELRSNIKDEDFFNENMTNEGLNAEYNNLVNKYSKIRDVILTLKDQQRAYERIISQRIPALISEFNMDPKRNLKSIVKSPMYIVISQNPHDIAKMSFERSWTSCYELGKGIHYKEMFCEVEEGGLVAYLITANDMNIENPKSRIHIRHLQSKSGKSIAVPENRMYGLAIGSFHKAVVDFVKSKQGEIPIDIYTLKGSNWTDSLEEEMMLASENGNATPEEINAMIENANLVHIMVGEPRFIVPIEGIRDRIRNLTEIMDDDRIISLKFSINDNSEAKIAELIKKLEPYTDIAKFEFNVGASNMALRLVELIAPEISIVPYKNKYFLKKDFTLETKDRLPLLNQLKNNVFLISEEIKEVNVPKGFDIDVNLNYFNEEINKANEVSVKGLTRYLEEKQDSPPDFIPF